MYVIKTHRGYLVHLEIIADKVKGNSIITNYHHYINNAILFESRSIAIKTCKLINKHYKEHKIAFKAEVLHYTKIEKQQWFME